jgi:L-rhamnose mutarotase
MTGRMRRIGLRKRLRPEKVEEYRTLHAAVWAGRAGAPQRVQYPQLLHLLADAGKSSFCHGEDFEVDAGKMAADPVTQRCGSLPTCARSPMRRAKGGSGGRAWKNFFITPDPGTLAPDLALDRAGDVSKRHCRQARRSPGPIARIAKASEAERHLAQVEGLGNPASKSYRESLRIVRVLVDFSARPLKQSDERTSRRAKWRGRSYSISYWLPRRAKESERVSS